LSKVHSPKIYFSLVRSRQAEGKIISEHLGGLGGIAPLPSVRQRLEFWRQLRERIAGLDSETRAGIIGDIAAKVPMVTAEERQQFHGGTGPFVRTEATSSIRARLSKILPPAVDPDRVARALDGFDGLAGLEATARKQLIADLVHAIGYARAGVDVGKRGVSNTATMQQIFIGDVARTLQMALKTVGDDLLFGVVREIAHVGDIELPKGLKHAAKRAREIKYGASERAVQTVEPADRKKDRLRIVAGTKR
jgi:hypothetical protein